jgi:Zn-dependent protease with chaperone function
MRFDEFKALVAMYEAEAAADPEGYVRQVWRTGMMGVAYLWGVVIFLFVSLLGTALIFVYAGVYAGLIVALPLIYAMQSVSRAMQIKRSTPPPERALTRADAPGLFALLDELGGRVDSVELSGDLNAAMAYTPRLGLLGGAKHRLILGLPLLLALSEREAAAVIAHELGHMSGGHSARTGWIYRQRVLWSNLRTHEAQDELSSSILKPFWTWIMPRFDAMSFVLSRLQEYEADASAARATSPQIMASALARIHTESERLAYLFWRPLFEESDRKAPRAPLLKLASFLTEPRDEVALRRHLKELLRVETGLVDTHPCLRERLDALGVAALPPLEPVERSAAHAWLAAPDDKLAMLEASCADEIKARWVSHRDQRREHRARLEAARDEAGSAEARSYIEALLLLSARAPEDAATHMAAHTARWPQHAQGWYLRGLISMWFDDEEGVAQACEARRLDPELAFEVIAEVIRFYQLREDDDEAALWREELVRLLDGQPAPLRRPDSESLF